MEEFPTATLSRDPRCPDDATQPCILQGGGGLTLRGTIYLTNTLAIMSGNASQYQALELQGTPGSSTQVIGEIIVGALSLGGNANITMTLDPGYTLNIRQVALVK